MFDQIYTSYFANLRNIPEDVVPISICQIVPDGYKGLTYKKVAPPSALIAAYKRKPDENKYIKEYTEQVLNNFNQFNILKELEELVPAGTKKIVLVCYEKPGDFCHRKLLARWFKKVGITITEYKEAP